MPELMYLSCKIMIGLNIAGMKNLACQSKVALPQPESRCSALRPFQSFNGRAPDLESGHVRRCSIFRPIGFAVLDMCERFYSAQPGAAKSGWSAFRRQASYPYG